MLLHMWWWWQCTFRSCACTKAHANCALCSSASFNCKLCVCVCVSSSCAATLLRITNALCARERRLTSHTLHARMRSAMLRECTSTPNIAIAMQHCPENNEACVLVYTRHANAQVVYTEPAQCCREGSHCRRTRKRSPQSVCKMCSSFVARALRVCRQKKKRKLARHDDDATIRCAQLHNRIESANIISISFARRRRRSRRCEHVVVACMHACMRAHQ